ncbi:MAG: hypothetical protein IKD22_03610 [Lentisphaeria bacterium]|nr:hypothetical protein [Lentisphaeria bacterium]
MEKNSGNQTEFLVSGKYCPQCNEVLTPADLEMFPRCPYCDHQFQDGPELEQFILRPVLNRWVANCFNWFSR